MSDLVARVVVPDRGVDVAVDVPSGTTTALVGPNGAGKSTVLDVVAGLVTPTSGRVRLGDQELLGLPPHRRHVALLAQDAALFPHLTVLENVAFGPRARGRRRGAARAAARRRLEEVGMQDLGDRMPHEVSGGQAQRIGIARALAAEPDLLLLDEPTAALDVEAAPSVRTVLRHVLAGTTTMLVTHSLEDVLVLADRVVVLQDGGVVDQGSVADVLERPSSGFLGSLAGLNVLVGHWDGTLVSIGSWTFGAARSTARAAPGDEVVAVFGPSVVEVVPDDSVAHVGPRCAGTVTGIARLGGRVQVHVVSDDGRADVRAHLALDASSGLRPGSRVEVRIDPQHVSVHARR